MVFLIVLLALLAVLVVYFKWCYSYWTRKGVKSLEPVIPFGNVGAFFSFKLSFAEQWAMFYKQFKKEGLRHGGVYMLTRPFYVPVDPAIVKDIMQKNFSHFINRGLLVHEELDPLSTNLFNLEGDKWRNLRVKLTPTFTSGKMKMMFEIMALCAREMNALMDQISSKREDANIKEILARYSTDVISSCAFGIESNSLKNPDTEFRHYGKRIVNNNSWESLKTIAQMILPSWFLSTFKVKATKDDVEKFFLGLVKETVDYRIKNNIHRKDFLQLLLQLEDNSLSLNELSAQVFVFFLAGFETSSSAMTFTLYELSKNLHLQDKLRNEINDVLAKHNNQITYDAITEMTYMDQVLNETLRKYPSLAFLNRECTIPYDVPNTNVRIEKGTPLIIPILGLHYDPEFYPNPEVYDPERFTEENKRNRPPFTYLPFGEGPRICIGMRFGLLQSKLALATILGNYSVTLSSKTKQHLVMDKRSIVTAADSPIWLKIDKINNNC